MSEERKHAIPESYNSFKIDLIERMDNLRREHINDNEFSLASIARKAGIASSALSTFREDNRVSRGDVVFKLADAMGYQMTTPDDLDAIRALIDQAPDDFRKSKNGRRLLAILKRADR